MGNRKYVIELTKEERERLEKFASTGNHPAPFIRRARIVLAQDTSDGRVKRTDAEIAEMLGITRQTVQMIKKDWLKMSMEEFLQRKKRETPPVPPKADGRFEAHLIALCQSEPPEGYARWTMRLLASRVVELGCIDSVSSATVCRTLKKMNFSLI